MKRLTEKTSEIPGIQHLSFSVDPEYDTPSVLKAYAASYQIGTNWRFITGDSAEIRETVEGAIKISMDNLGLKNGVPDIVHQNHFVLLDAQAHIRGYYDSTDEKRMARIIEDARSLARP